MATKLRGSVLAEAAVPRGTTGCLPRACAEAFREGEAEAVAVVVDEPVDVALTLILPSTPTVADAEAEGRLQHALAALGAAEEDLHSASSARISGA